MISGFFGMLESVPTYKNAICFVSIESNLTWIQANDIKEVIENRGGGMNVVFVNRDPQSDSSLAHPLSYHIAN